MDEDNFLKCDIFCNGFQVRVNTRLLYQQTKFNLLREESEGYAKLVIVSPLSLSLSLCASPCLLVTALDALSLFPLGDFTANQI